MWNGDFGSAGWIAFSCTQLQRYRRPCDGLKMPSYRSFWSWVVGCWDLSDLVWVLGRLINLLPLFWWDIVDLRGCLLPQSFSGCFEFRIRLQSSLEALGETGAVIRAAWSGQARMSTNYVRFFLFVFFLFFLLLSPCEPER